MVQNSSYVFILLATLPHLVCSQYLSYTSDIRPILEKHCVSCHSPGEVGAMPLMTYEDVAAYGQMIQYVTSTKLMPPWYADPAYSHFSNERVMTEEEVEKISHWVNTGMNEGALPYGLVVSKTVGVTVIPRMPDTILAMAQVFEQYGIYLDQYQVFALPTGLTGDRWVEGIEFVPGNKQIVRAASVSIAPRGQFDSLDQWDPRYGYYSFGGLGKTPEYPFWYTWCPQQKLTWYGDGKARLLPAKSDLLVHIHYGPTGKPQLDSSYIRLWFATKKVTQPVITAPLINPFGLTNDSLHMAANTKKTFHASYTVPYDVHILSLTPQANLICRSWEVYAELPNEDVPLKLLKIHDWNFNWKQTFHLPEPVLLPSGSVIHCLARYDNTTDNPCNPSDKPVDIGWGAHLFSELLFVHAEVLSPDTSLPVHLLMPAVVSSGFIPLTLHSTVNARASLQLTDASGNTSTLLKKLRIRRGSSSHSVSVDALSGGNYSLGLLGKNKKVLGRHLFIKMKEDGM